MPLNKTLTHEELMAAEMEAAHRKDVNTPAQDERWDELEQRMKDNKPAGSETDGDGEIVEGEEVATAARAQTSRVFRNVCSRRYSGDRRD